MPDQSSSPESRIAADEQNANAESTAEAEAEQAARSYLDDAPGETVIERAANAAEQAERDAQQAGKQLQELRQLGRRASLAVDVLEGVKRRVADDAAGAVLSDTGAADENSEDSRGDES